MTRLRWMQAVLAVLVVVMIWSWTREPPPSPVPERQRPPRRPAGAGSPAPGAAASQPGATVRRNLFEYGEAPAAATPAIAVEVLPTPTPASSTSASAAPIKLVGLVRQAAGLRAALAVGGEVVLGAPGQNVGGYTVVAIDEDRGVVLNGPDGRTIELQREEPR